MEPAGFGTGALQGAVDAAIGNADPIDAAIEGLAGSTGFFKSLIDFSKCRAALCTKVFALFICSSSGNSHSCFPLTIAKKALTLV
jgi:hypothetical protein